MLLILDLSNFPIAPLQAVPTAPPSVAVLTTVMWLYHDNFALGILIELCAFPNSLKETRVNVTFNASVGDVTLSKSFAFRSKPMVQAATMTVNVTVMYATTVFALLKLAMVKAAALAGSVAHLSAARSHCFHDGSASESCLGVDALHRVGKS